MKIDAPIAEEGWAEFCKAAGLRQVGQSRAGRRAYSFFGPLSAPIVIFGPCEVSIEYPSDIPYCAREAALLRLALAARWPFDKVEESEVAGDSLWSASKVPSLPRRLAPLPPESGKVHQGRWAEQSARPSGIIAGGR